MPRYWRHHPRPKRYHPHHHHKTLIDRHLRLERLGKPRREILTLSPRRAHTSISTILHNVVFILVPLLIIGATVVPFFTVQPLVSFKDKVIAVVSAPWIIDKEEARVICLEAFEGINNWRAEEGTSALVWDEEMYELATTWSEYMDKTGDYRHSDYTERFGYAECITNCLYLDTPIGITSWFSGKDIVESWKYYGSYMHWAILLDSDMHYGAVGIPYDSGASFATFLASR